MEDFRTLRILDRCQWMFTRLGTDYPVMRRILQMKLTMDGRRSATILLNSNRKKNDYNVNEHSNQFIKSLWFYALMGLMMVPLLLMGKHYLFQMSLVFGMFSFIIMTTMIADFSSVMLDVRDHQVLLTKPINRRTINAAKTVHVIIYLLFLTGALMAAPLAAALFRHGISFTLLFLAEIVLLDLFFVVLTALIYLFILQIFDGEKLKDIINYVQIGLTIAITIGYQLISRSFEIVQLNIVFHLKWWQVLIPPVWYGSLMEMLFEGNLDKVHVAFSVLAVIVPILAIVIYIQCMPAFERNLRKLAYQSGGAASSGRLRSDRFLNWLCADKMEWAFFRFAGKMMKTEREFKLKVYPSLGFSIILPYIFLFTTLRYSSWAEVSASSGYLYIYSSLLLIPTVIMMLRYSGTYKGSWIYGAAPLITTTALYKGVLKAVYVKLFLPMFVVESIIHTAVFGYRIIPDLVAIAIVASLYGMICFRSMKQGLPFSESFEWAQKKDGWKVFPLILLIGGIGFLHYGSTMFPYGVYAFIAVSAALNVCLWKFGFRR
ncbi:hypothetical protein [Paenibacillus sp. SI8]|uniref:hypothetical protein n=1 Tax=unclassified Paenibacillus TaxID=185978 RepID=UPI0034657DA0